MNQDSRVVCFRVTLLDRRLVALSVDWCDVGPVEQVRIFLFLLPVDLFHAFLLLSFLR